MNKILTPKRIKLSSDGWTLNILSERVATITDPIGRRKVSYFGFDAYEKAQVFREQMIQNKQATAAIIRHAERLTKAFECKAWGVSTELLIELAAKDIPT